MNEEIDWIIERPHIPIIECGLNKKGKIGVSIFLERQKKYFNFIENSQVYLLNHSIKEYENKKNELKRKYLEVGGKIFKN